MRQDAKRIFRAANANETQRSSATLSGMSGRQKEKGASSGRRQMQKIVFGNSFGDAGSEGFLHTASVALLRCVSFALGSAKNSLRILCILIWK